MPQEFERLVPGQYILTEEEAPNGYEIAEEIVFTLEETAEVQTMDMLDQKRAEGVQTGDNSLIVSRALLLALAALLAGWCCGEETERKSKKKDWNRNLFTGSG